MLPGFVFVCLRFDERLQTPMLAKIKQTERHTYMICNKLIYKIPNAILNNLYSHGLVAPSITSREGKHGVTSWS